MAFISYSGERGPRAQLDSALRELGVTPWRDVEDLDFGNRTTDAIEAARADCWCDGPRAQRVVRPWGRATGAGVGEVIAPRLGMALSVERSAPRWNVLDERREADDVRDPVEQRHRRHPLIPDLVVRVTYLERSHAR
jgi:hypothetical protein